MSYDGGKSNKTVVSDAAVHYELKKWHIDNHYSH